jgi:hypothetical protein
MNQNQAKKFASIGATIRQRVNVPTVKAIFDPGGENLTLKTAYFGGINMAEEFDAGFADDAELTMRVSSSELPPREEIIGSRIQKKPGEVYRILDWNQSEMSPEVVYSLGEL